MSNTAGTEANNVTDPAVAAAAAGARSDTGGQPAKDTSGADGAGNGDGSPGALDAQTDPFADLPAETREWLGKREVKSLRDAANLAHEQSKLLGNAIRVPGEKATDEERAAFLNKLGRPEKPDGYEFKVPEKLPENLPYDAERAKGFKQLAHDLGLTAAQAGRVHDWAAENAVNDFSNATAQMQQQTEERARGETDKLVKRWGPLDGETARANLEFADRVLQQAGGPELVEEFKRLNLIGPNKEILSEPLALAFARMGSAIYKEDGVLHGTADRIGNPFADGDGHNRTKQMELYRADPDQARALIAAAGKKPSDFGLKD